MNLRTWTKPEWGRKNILQLPMANELRWHIVYYRVSHSIMIIRFTHRNLPKPAPYLMFMTPYYFEGPMHWIGGEINIGEKDETKIFFEQYETINEIELDNKLNYYRLYQIDALTVSKKSCNILLVAGELMLSFKPLPSDLLSP